MFENEFPDFEWDRADAAGSSPPDPHMQMSAKRITRVSADELDKIEDRTDWSRVDRLSDADIRRAMRDDPDWADDLDIDWSKAQTVRPRVKRA